MNRLRIISLDFDGVLHPTGEGTQLVVAAPLGNDRWLAIQAWVAEQAETLDLLIVDDARGELPATLPFTLVVCDPSTGLSDPQVRESIQRWLVQR